MTPSEFNDAQKRAQKAFDTALTFISQHVPPDAEITIIVRGTKSRTTEGEMPGAITSTTQDPAGLLDWFTRHLHKAVAEEATNKGSVQ